MVVKLEVKTHELVVEAEKEVVPVLSPLVGLQKEAVVEELVALVVEASAKM